MYPSFNILGRSVMPDGKEVLIMSPEQWNTYCFNFNQLNGVPQPPQLVKDLEECAADRTRKHNYIVEKRRNERYRNSCRGRTAAAVWWYFFFAVPFIMGVGLYEDTANAQSPRINYWRQAVFSTPNLLGWLLFEGAQAGIKQLRDEKTAKKSAGDEKKKWSELVNAPSYLAVAEEGAGEETIDQETGDKDKKNSAKNPEDQTSDAFDDDEEAPSEEPQEQG